jgi:hypothetical protein
MDVSAISAARTEILKLRARVVTLEKATLAVLELALRIRPEELDMLLEKSRRQLELGYLDADFAADVTQPQERAFLSAEVERHMRSLQSEMGFPQGIPSAEEG